MAARIWGSWGGRFALASARRRIGLAGLLFIGGKLAEINLKQEGFAPGHRFGGKPYLVRDYLLQRIRLGEGPPLKLDGLADQLEVLRQDPNVSRVNAELRPGLKPGEAALDVTVA